MAGPWEKYQQPQSAPAGPWTQYQPPPVSQTTPRAAVAPEAPIDPTEGMSGFDRFMAGAGKSVVDTGRGLRQAGTDAARHFVEAGFGIEAPGLRQSLAEQQAAIDESRRLDAPLLDTGAGLAGNVAGYGAQLLTPAALARGTMAGRSLLPTTLSGNAAQGAVIGAAQPVATGEERVQNIGLGAGAGAGGSALGKGVGALASRAKGAIAPHVREVYEAAKSRGIQLSPAQISDSRFMKNAQYMLRSVPFTGAQGRFDRQVSQFNRQLASTIGEDAPVVNAQVYSMAKQRQAKQFEDLTARNQLQVNDRLLRSLTNIAESSRMAGEQVNNQVESAINALYSQAVTGQGGVRIPGQAYQAFDAQLNQIIKGGGAPAHFLGNVQSAVRRAMDESISPEDSAAWRQLRKEFGNRKTIAPLVAKAADGPISPASLQGAVTSTKSAKEAMASGTRGELGELAKIGQRLKEPPSSGSPERLLAGGAFNPVNWPYYALGGTVGATAGRALDSKTLARIIMRENPGMTREAVAKIVNRMALPAGQTYANRRPLEIDIVGGTPISEAEARRLYEP